MTAKVGLASSVSYGIGVQNRYSAFLDDEDGFGSPSGLAIGATHKQAAAKQQRSPNAGSQGGHNSAKSVAGKTNARLGANKQDQQQKAGQQKRQEGQKNQRASGHQQQQQQQSPKSYVQQTAKHSGANVKHGNFTTANNNNNRYARNQLNSNQHHQSNVSQQNNSANKENSSNNNEFGQQDHHGKFTRNFNNNNNAQRGPSNRRQYYGSDDKKVSNTTTQGEDGQGTSFSNHQVSGVQYNEEEKRRRQQKRALDLKHKDPEKREARRQQSAINDQSGGSNGNQADSAQPGENQLGPRGPRNRRPFTGNDAGRNSTGASEDLARGLRGSGGARGRGPRRGPEQTGTETNGLDGGERREGPPANRSGGGGGGGDRPQLNRNRFGTGSRGSRGSRGEEPVGKFGRDSDRQKPIPNFSDKLDFPSLAS